MASCWSGSGDVAGDWRGRIFMGNKFGRRRQVVDERYTRPQGLYQHKDVDHKKLRKLILDSKLAPCYPGDEDSTLDLEECPICFLVWFLLHPCCFLWFEFEIYLFNLLIAVHSFVLVFFSLNFFFWIFVVLSESESIEMLHEGHMYRWFYDLPIFYVLLLFDLISMNVIVFFLQNAFFRWSRRNHLDLHSILALCNLMSCFQLCTLWCWKRVNEFGNGWFLTLSDALSVKLLTTRLNIVVWKQRRRRAWSNL